MNQQPCPSHELLRRVIAGEASPEEMQSVSGHLESCERCRRVLEESGVTPANNAGLRQAWQKLDEEVPEQAAVGLFPADPEFRVENDCVVLPNGIRLGRPRANQYIGYLDEFDIERVLGSGAMGTVLKAYQDSLNRYVAVKMMTPVLAQDAVARRRFLDEARHAAELRHTNIVTVYAVSPDATLPYIVMEYVKGKSLAMLIEEEGPLEPRRAARIARQILAGLSHAHARRKVHRDIKPKNILLEDQVEVARIADFGLTVAIGQAVRHTEAGQVVGTPAYMSPEQAEGRYDVDARSDLFSVGTICYEMLTGILPFDANNPLAIMENVKQAAPAPLRTLSPAVPPELARIVERAMQRDVAKRYASAGEFERDLRTFLGESPTQTFWRRLATARGIGRAVIATLATIIVVAGVVALIYLMTDHGTPLRAP